MGKIVLCADTESLIRPMLIGLEDAVLDGKDWLVSISDSGEARQYIKEHDVDEAWIVSSDDLVGINLAAAVRKDRPDLPLYLIAFDISGSALSRASQAGVTGTLTASTFCNRFDVEARRRALVSEAAEIDVDEMIDGLARVHPPGDKADVATSPASEAQVVEAACQRDGNAFVMSFLGGSGGVGKSTVCAVAAYRAAARGYRTVVIDCDMQFGDLHQMMGMPDAASIDDVLADPDVIERIEREAPPDMPAVVRAPARLERSEDLSKHVGQLVGICASAFDVVLVNTGANWVESHAQLLERSAASVFLIDQRASSVHACKHALDLCMRMGIASASFVYALNRCKRGALFSSIDIANVLQGAHVVELKDGGSEVEELLGAGLCSELALSRNDLCLSVDELLDELLPAGAGEGGFVSVVSRRGKGRRSGRSEGTDMVSARGTGVSAAGAAHGVKKGTMRGKTARTRR